MAISAESARALPERKVNRTRATGGLFTWSVREA
jgi:hypothetical protein